jgi:hypothetical protein
LASATHKKLVSGNGKPKRNRREELLSVSHYTGVTMKRESLENEDDHLTNAESLVGYWWQFADTLISQVLA